VPTSTQVGQVVTGTPQPGGRGTQQADPRQLAQAACRDLIVTTMYWSRTVCEPRSMCAGLDNAAGKVEGAGKDLRGNADDAVDNIRSSVKSAAGGACHISPSDRPACCVRV